jgi:hypothetical protein
VSLIVVGNVALWFGAGMLFRQFIRSSAWQAVEVLHHAMWYVLSGNLGIAAVLQIYVLIRYIGWAKHELVNMIFRLPFRLLYMINWFLIVVQAAIILAV